MPAKGLEHPFANFDHILQFPSLPLSGQCFWRGSGMVGRFATLMECFDNNLANQHCIGAEEMLKPKRHG